MDPENSTPGPADVPAGQNQIINPNSEIINSGEGQALPKTTRNGFVARLPKELRDQINQMLDDGVPYRRILDTIGEPASHISEGCIGEWKKGGYLDWVRDRDRKDALNATRESALDLVKSKPGVTVQEAGRAIASGQLYELLLSFDPTDFIEAVKEKPDLYFRLLSSLSRLSEGEAACSHRRLQEQLLEAKLKASKVLTATDIPTEEKLKEIARLIRLL